MINKKIIVIFSILFVFSCSSNKETSENKNNTINKKHLNNIEQSYNLEKKSDRSFVNKELFQKALNSYLAKDYKKSISILEKLTKFDKNNPRIFLYL
jgi:hypothetical protein